MSAKILIIDFEDSFTYNVAAVLFDAGLESTVIHHEAFFLDEFFEKWIKKHGKKAVILGPGPGHPEVYKKYFSHLSILQTDESIYLMGICLGHQILGLKDGLSIKKVPEQMHGQTVTINFKGRFLQVQRYNSLGVFNRDEEIFHRKFKNGISYQFHPESIGTEDNQIFFEDLRNFIQS